MIVPAWTELHFADRRYITVVEDAELARKAAFAAARRDLANSMLKTWRNIRPAVLSNKNIETFTARIEEEAKTLISGDVTNSADGPPILEIPRSQAEGIDFGPQGWLPKVVYAANPFEAHSYHSVATFHEEMFLHRIAELERLLIALCVRSYRIEHTSTEQKSTGGGIGAGFAIFGVELGASGTSRRLQNRIWQGTLRGGTPQLPSDLHWYPRERDWQNLVESRLSGRRRDFSFTLKRYEDFGVNAGLLASARIAKLDLGGQFLSCQQVEFQVTGSF